MRILILNWRDIKNPASGGAEILTHELAKRWVENGHEVTLFSSWFEGAESLEVIDGVRIVRKGNPDARYFFGSVHFKAWWYYHKVLKGKIDVVVDEIHGLPFFTPLYVKEKKVALICEVADEIWSSIYGPFFGALGRLIEILYLRVLYKNIQFLTISQSTKDELIKNSVNSINIHTIPMGIRRPIFSKFPQKEKIQTLIYVGRLSKSKGIEDALIVLKETKKKIPSLKLWIVGRGDAFYVDTLKKLTTKMKLDESVTFFGYLSEKKKFELMARAHILLIPSIKEGFGLIVPEAGIVGTVSIAYNVSGLKDIITNGKNGILVERRVENMSEAVIHLLTDEKFYSKIKKGAKEYAQNLNFEKSARIALEILS